MFHSLFLSYCLCFFSFINGYIVVINSFYSYLESIIKKRSALKESQSNIFLPLAALMKWKNGMGLWDRVMWDRAMRDKNMLLELADEEYSGSEDEEFEDFSDGSGIVRSFFRIFWQFFRIFLAIFSHFFGNFFGFFWHFFRICLAIFSHFFGIFFGYFEWVPIWDPKKWPKIGHFYCRVSFHKRTIKKCYTRKAKKRKAKQNRPF